MMQFIDLHKQYDKLQEDINENIKTVLTHKKFIMGPEVYKLEDKLKTYVGVKHCITCANGTDALSMILLALGIGEGDAVFVPSFTFMATAEVVSLCGATPYFVDIDLTTFNMDPQKLKQAIIKACKTGSHKPKAIIPVDLFGLPANYSEIDKIGKRYNLYVIEDGAQGFGGMINERRVGSFGYAATTSFFPAKPLGCYGDGGAIFTNNDELAERLASIRVHGKGAEKYDNVRVGMNSRLDTIQAAILLVKFKAFIEYELDNRIRVAKKYDEELTSIVKTPKVPTGYISSWAQYTILLKSYRERNMLKKLLGDIGIPTAIYYPKPLHIQTVYKNNNDFNGNNCVAEHASSNVLSLPMHPYLEMNDISTITRNISKIIHNLRRL